MLNDENFLNQILDDIVYGERSGDKAVSPKGAVGRYQLMPEISRAFGVQDPTDPVQAREGAKKLVQEIGGRALKAKPDIDPETLRRTIFAGYNGGIAAERAILAGAQPPADETRNYLQRISTRGQSQPLISSDLTAKYQDQIQWARSQGFSDQQILNNIRADEREKNQREAAIANTVVNRQRLLKEALPSLKVEIAKSGDVSKALDQIAALDGGKAKFKEDIEFFRQQGIPDNQILLELAPQLEVPLNANVRRSKKSFVDNTLDGIKSGIESMGHGLAQMVSPIASAIENRKNGTDIDYTTGLRRMEAKRRQDPDQIALGETVGGTIGSMLPEVAVGAATAPIGGGLALGGRLLAQAGVNALTNSVLSPSTSTAETLANAGIGAAFGAGGELVAPAAKKIAQSRVGQAAGQAAEMVADSKIVRGFSNLKDNVFGKTDTLIARSDHEAAQIITRQIGDELGVDTTPFTRNGVFQHGDDTVPGMTQFYDQVKSKAGENYNSILRDRTATVDDKAIKQIDSLISDPSVDREIGNEIENLFKIEKEVPDTIDVNGVPVQKQKGISLRRAANPERELNILDREIQQFKDTIDGKFSGTNYNQFIAAQRRLDSIDRVRKMVLGSDALLLKTTKTAVPNSKNVVNADATKLSSIIAKKNRQLEAITPKDGGELSAAQKKLKESLEADLKDLETVFNLNSAKKIDDLDRLKKFEEEDLQVFIKQKIAQAKNELERKLIQREKVAAKKFQSEQVGLVGQTKKVKENRKQIKMTDLNDVLNNVEDRIFSATQGQSIDYARLSKLQDIRNRMREILDSNLGDTDKAKFRDADEYYGKFKVFEKLMSKMNKDPLAIADPAKWNSVINGAQYRGRALKDEAPLQNVQDALAKRDRRITLAKQLSGQTQEVSALRDAALIGGLGGGSTGFIFARGARALDRVPLNKSVQSMPELDELVANRAKRSVSGVVLRGSKSVSNQAADEIEKKLIEAEKQKIRERAKAFIKNNNVYGERRSGPRGIELKKEQAKQFIRDKNMDGQALATILREYFAD